jgi:hypothetical protein
VSSISVIVVGISFLLRSLAAKVYKRKASPGFSDEAFVAVLVRRTQRISTCGFSQELASCARSNHKMNFARVAASKYR